MNKKKEKFLGNENLKGIIVGGPGPTKYDFIEYLTDQLKQKGPDHPDSRSAP